MKEIEGENYLGIDLGASSVRIVHLQGKECRKTWIATHYGRPVPTLLQGLAEFNVEKARVMVTGVNAEALHELCNDIPVMDDIPAIIEGVRRLVPEAGSIIEIGSQSARFITGLDRNAPRFAVNEHCAGGTGSFFEDQMNRLGLKIEDYSRLTEEAGTVPRLSGRCAVFAKTDIIHRMQEGVSTPDILLGLCYAMVRNFKAVIVKDLEVRKPVVFCGGVTCNSGAVKAIKDVFGLKDNELIVPEMARFEAAYGAAVHADTEFVLADLMKRLEESHTVHERLALAKLDEEGSVMHDPVMTEKIPASGAVLGIDIGSTSTNLVIVGSDGSLVDFQYLRTAGNPERAVRSGLAAIHDKYGDITFRAVGVTGSGRERIGRMIGADAVRDEITAQARAAKFWLPDTDTVFEIGGQDSKYISLYKGEVKDFQMNKICAAGTGSFVEEQAARMNIPLQDFGPLALSGEHPADLGERCTVFIETAIASAVAEGVSQADIAAGLCHAIVRNYLHKVVGSHPVGQHIVLQGGVAYNPGIVAAFRSAYPEIQVNPCFAVSGAFGAAMLASEAVPEGAVSSFKGFAFPAEDRNEKVLSADVKRNIAFYNKPVELLLDGYDGKLDPAKKTVGVPYALMIHKFFPMANAYFKTLGYNVLLSKPTDEDTILLSQQLAKGETCYPVKLIYGHMQQLIDAGVDYIFMPSIHTMKHETSKTAHNYGCVYMQTAPRSIASALHIEEKGIELLNPVFDLDFGKQAMAQAMVGLGKQLNKPKPVCVAALMAGSMAVRKHEAAVEAQGKVLLDSMQPDDKVLVLITRNYGVSDPILNMGIPQLLLERGCKVITLSHLPAHSLDISKDHPNLYWPFGQHILSGAKMVAHHPNLYAVYLTNHGCGPDSMMTHLFKEEMGDKPYLQIEVDEHFSPVGVVTRIEAFLNSLASREAVRVPADFDLKDVAFRDLRMRQTPDKEQTLVIPDMGLYTDLLKTAFRTCGYKAEAAPRISETLLQQGRSAASSKEYLPFAAMFGTILQDQTEHPGTRQYLLPCTRGSEADGQYSRAIEAELGQRGITNAVIVSPYLETMCELPDFDLFARAIAYGDLCYAMPADNRASMSTEKIPSWPELLELAESLSRIPQENRRLAAVGTPLMITSLDDGVLEHLEKENNTIVRMPLLEYLWMLWKDQDDAEHWQKQLDETEQHIRDMAERAGKYSIYETDPEQLRTIADQYLPSFAGANGRYRYAKAVQMGSNAAAVLHMAPRYENTAMVMNMRSLPENCQAPFFNVDLDGDWDESSWSRLNSFLYYCR